MLHRWTEPAGDSSNLETHLAAQYVEQLRKGSFNHLLDGPRHSIRRSIGEFLFGASRGEERFSVVFCSVADGNDELHMRAHLPVRTSPAGSPLILLTVFDEKRVEALEHEKKIRRREWKKTFGEVFGSMNKGVCVALTKEEMKLWRYVLKLNSLKISRNQWPIPGLPIGENRPWMATFVSPLYAETKGIA